MKIDFKFIVLVLLICCQPSKAISIELPLRDILAGFAICGLYAHPGLGRGDVDYCVDLAYKTADVMMKYHKR
jgi:hypothetical protein